jgi:hypothetical protein
MLDGNISGAVRILSSDDSIAPHTAEVLNILRSKHPQGDPNAVYPPAPDDDPVFESVKAHEIVQAISSFPNGSACGMDGFFPQHLKDLISTSAGDIATKLTGSLAALGTLMLSGNVNLEFCPCYMERL